MIKHFCDKCLKEIETKEIMELVMYLKLKTSDTFTFELCQECSQHIIDEIDGEE